MVIPAAKGASAHILELLDDVSAAGDQIDAERRLPDDLVHQLKTRGAFRSLIPESLGGLGLNLLQHMQIVRELAERDASTAWCVNQCSVIGITSLWLPAASAAALWSEPDAAVANGPPFGCVLKPQDGGYLLNGRWGFSSGSQHARYMMCAAKVGETKSWRIAFCRPEQVEFHDTWQVPGLRGTGSFEFTANDVRVDEEWTGNQGAPATFDEVVTRIPTGLLFAVSFASLALGVARGGLNACIDLAQDKVPRFSAKSVRQDPDSQKMIGEAEIRWRAAYAFLTSTVNEVLEAVADSEQPSVEQRASMRMAGTHTIRESVAVMDLAYTVAGSTAIYRDNPLQRRFQDLHVISQHLQARLSYYGVVGRYVLGEDYEPGPLN